MDRAPDRRVRRTREALQVALVELMTEKGYDAVTVQDVVDRADVSRSTFYAHFTDKEDLLVSGIEGLRPLLVGGAAPDEPHAPFSFSLELLRHVQGQRRLLRVLAPRTGGAVVQRWFTKLVADLVRDDLLALPRGGGTAQRPESAELTVAFITGAFMSLLTAWLATGTRQPPEEVDAVFRDLVLHGLSVP